MELVCDRLPLAFWNHLRERPDSVNAVSSEVNQRRFRQTSFMNKAFNCYLDVFNRLVLVAPMRIQIEPKST